MHINKTFAALAIASIFMVGCKNETKVSQPEATVVEAPKEKKPIEAANLQTANMAIEGMTCAMGCAKTIEKKLAESEGVEKATVDFDKKLATISFDKTVQNPETLTKIIEGVADGKTYKVVNTKS
ncbi:Heavy-metal-associated domain-containing protein [Flavobacterium succinicans]|uniref:Heavy-metal-associated domain-containing protein n=1 Tax=Flavobacterium succinicans TaxID=29536 RepID=A0A1I4VMS4_9FLAO|nr:heavy metal-associated domain-containing protein [Flavobacterium succinicans]SFN02365.1 Heavy-metal-associated domain-containing protein [Flavobacterium succinicans]